MTLRLVDPLPPPRRLHVGYTQQEYARLRTATYVSHFASAWKMQREILLVAPNKGEALTVVRQPQLLGLPDHKVGCGLPAENYSVLENLAMRLGYELTDINSFARDLILTYIQIKYGNEEFEALVKLYGSARLHSSPPRYRHLRPVN
jgi:hypothetical protein